MSRVAIISKYFGYSVGGAERSVLEIMKNKERNGHRIVTMRVDNIRTYQAQKLKINFPNSWEVHHTRLPQDMIRFRFIEYYLNKRRFISAFNSIPNIDVLYSYGLYGPALINAFRGNTVYLVRDEYGLGWNINYYNGIRGGIQDCYHMLEWPLRIKWKKELTQAILKSDLIANSKFIANELRKISPNAKMEIIQPQIDVSSLVSNYDQYRDTVHHKGIVAIGDNVLKGGDLVRKIAAILPEEQFYLFDRHNTKPVKRDNLTLMPWQDIGRVYAHAKLLIVPSRWYEAFPRVILESKLLNIPVLASARGGIPEALNNDPQYMIQDLEDPEAWKKAIMRII